MSFAQKKLSVNLQLANGVFANGQNVATLENLRMSAEIVMVGGADQSSAEIGIYGLPLSLMNQMSNVGTSYNKSFANGMSISAIDGNGASNLVFVGQILSAFVDAEGMPEVCFRIIGKPGLYHKIKPSTPTSISGSADVASTLQNLAKQMGLGFENNGVNVKLANPYFSGSAWKQIISIAEHAGIEWIVDKGTLAISNPGKPRDGEPILISPQTGLVGYPAFNANEVIVRALYDPRVKYNGEIQIQSSLTAANGKFIVKKLSYELDAMVFNGRWFMTMGCYTSGATTP